MVHRAADEQPIKINLNPTYTNIIQGLGLSHRESYVVELLAAGKDTREVLRIMQISDSTLRTHLTSIFRKCGVRNRAQLLAQVFQKAFEPRPSGH